MTTAAFCFRRPAHGCQDCITPTHLPLRRNTYHLDAFLCRSSNVTVLAATSSPGGAATGGTQNKRTKINVVCADWHVETMPWSGTGPAFTNTTQTANDPDGGYRWSPQ